MLLDFDRRTVVRIGLAALLLGIASANAALFAQDKFIVVQSTTSTQNSG